MAGEIEGPYVFEHGDLWHVTRDRRDGRETGRRHVCSGTETLAVAYDAEDGVLHKHGASAGVEAWAGSTRAKLLAADCPEVANALTVVTFLAVPPAVAELNACIATTGRIARFPEALAAMADEVGPPPPWMGL